MKQYVNTNSILIGCGAVIFFLTVQMILLVTGRRLTLQGKGVQFLNFLKISAFSSFIIVTGVVVILLP